MRDVLEEDGHGVRPAAVFAVAAIAVISVAVLHNSLFRQAGVALPVTHLAVDAQSPRTVRLKHDPLLEEVQRQLLAAGYYKGPIDGVAGTHAREAIESYQHATGIAVTGTATPGLAEHIRYTREIAETTLFTGSVEADKGADARASIRRVQTGLAELAYRPGAIDGLMSEDTRKAISAFERDRRLAETGEISPALLAELAKLSGQSEMNPN